ncbi:MAG: TonB-dependent siderophore receptor [Nostoc sp.]|uniref:TonB-dependent siderophore receptor n=1 Tax=Nostoc sp. TaxID=1180 RepID=UPI002FF526FB
MKCWHLFSSVHLWLAIFLWACGNAFAIGPRGAQNRENLTTNLAQRVVPPADVYSGLRLRQPLKKWVNQNKVRLDKARSLEQTESKIRQLSEIEFPNTSAQMLVQSPAQQTLPVPTIVQVTSVKANPTNKGVEVILQTSKGQQLQLVNRSAGNNFIADIPNAQLRLPSGDAFTFRSQKPIAGLREITLANFDANTIRVTVTGEAGVPIVELFDSPDEGLIFSVASTAPSAQQGQPQTQQPQNQTQPSQPSASGDQPIELVVTGEQDGYRATDASTATKTDTPLRDIPLSIQVVPRQVLEDQQTRTLTEALRNVPGVAQGGGSTRGTYEVPLIRGFFGGFDIKRNGLRDASNLYAAFDRAGIDRVEVLKGPASVLYGEGSLGGVINYITKQPLNEPYHALEASVGSFNFYRGAVDLTGPLNPSKTVLYRLNLAAQTTESFLDFYNQQRYFVAPVVSWQLGDRTKITFSSEYQVRPQKNGAMGIPAEGSVLPNPNGKIPRNRNTNEPNSTSDTSILRLGYDLEHRFSSNWQLRSAFEYSSFQRYKNYLFNRTLAEDERTLGRQFTTGVNDERNYGIETYVVGKFATGSIRHQLVTGFNFTKHTDDTTSNFSQGATLDLFNPVYGRQPGPITSRYYYFAFTDSFGVYVQDQVTLASNLKLQLGLEFDTYKQTSGNRIDNTKENDYSDAFSPRVGIVYQPIEAISLYANYSRSFSPNTGRAFDGSVFEPLRGTSYEVGIKGDISNRLSATLAFYDLTLSNVPTTDPVNPDFSILTGEQRSKGVEFSVGGEILPGWNIIAGYAYTEAEVSNDTNSSLVGNLLDNVPKHSFNLWTSYEIQSGDFKGLGLGIGLFYVGQRQGDLDNTFTLPSYFLTEAAIFYKQDRFKAALNFKNLFDVDYFESAENRVNVFYGDPFTIQATISWEF